MPLVFFRIVNDLCVCLSLSKCMDIIVWAYHARGNKSLLQFFVFCFVSYYMLMWHWSMVIQTKIQFRPQSLIICCCCCFFVFKYIIIICVCVHLKQNRKTNKKCVLLCVCLFDRESFFIFVPIYFDVNRCNVRVLNVKFLIYSSCILSFLTIFINNRYLP